MLATTSKLIKILSLLLAIIFLFGCEKELPPLKLQKGQSMKELAVTDVNNNAQSLSLASGKYIILNIWATWCGPCRHEMPSLDRLANSLDKNKIEVIGLSVDTDDHVVREFLIERKVGFTSYMDPGMQAANDMFGVRVFPSTFIFSPEGKVVDIIEGWREWDTREMKQKMNLLITGK